MSQNVKSAYEISVEFKNAPVVPKLPFTSPSPQERDSHQYGLVTPVGHNVKENAKQPENTKDLRLTLTEATFESSDELKLSTLAMRQRSFSFHSPGPNRVVFLQSAPLVRNEPSTKALAILDSENERREIIYALNRGFASGSSNTNVSTCGSAAIGSAPTLPYTDATTPNSSKCNHQTTNDFPIMFESEHCTAAYFLEQLKRRDVAVIHYSGHGFNESLAFEDEQGCAQEFKAFSIESSILTNLPNNMLLFLNACKSASFARPIGNLKYERLAIVAINEVEIISDTAAITFARHFYPPLANGSTVSEAFEAAKLALSKHSKPSVAAEAKNYVLFGNENIRIFPQSTQPVIKTLDEVESNALNNGHKASWSSPFRPWLPFALPNMWQPQNITMYKILRLLKTKNSEFQPILLTSRPGLGRTTCLTALGRYICERSHMSKHYSRLPLLTLRTTVVKSHVKQQITHSSSKENLLSTIPPFETSVSYHILPASIATDCVTQREKFDSASNESMPRLSPRFSPINSGRNSPRPSSPSTWNTIPRGSVIYIDLEQTYIDLGKVLTDALSEIMQIQLDEISSIIEDPEVNASPASHEHVRQACLIAKVMQAANQQLIRNEISLPFTRKLSASESAQIDDEVFYNKDKTSNLFPCKQNEPDYNDLSAASGPGYVSPNDTLVREDAHNVFEQPSRVESLSKEPSKRKVAPLKYEHLLIWAKKKIVDAFMKESKRNMAQCEKSEECASLPGTNVIFPKSHDLKSTLKQVSGAFLAWHMLKELRVLHCINLHNNGATNDAPAVDLNFDHLWKVLSKYLSGQPVLLSAKENVTDEGVLKQSESREVHLQAQRSLFHLILIDNSDAGCSFFQRSLDILDTELPGPLVRPKNRDIASILIHAWNDAESRAKRSRRAEDLGSLSEKELVSIAVEEEREWRSGKVLDKVGAYLLRNIALSAFYYAAAGMSSSLHIIVDVASRATTAQFVMTSLSTQSIHVQFTRNRLVHLKHLFLSTLADEIIRNAEAQLSTEDRKFSKFETPLVFESMSSALCAFLRGPEYLNEASRKILFKDNSDSVMPSGIYSPGISKSLFPLPSRDFSVNAPSRGISVSAPSPLPSPSQQDLARSSQAVSSSAFSCDPHINDLKLLLLNHRKQIQQNVSGKFPASTPDPFVIPMIHKQEKSHSSNTVKRGGGQEFSAKNDLFAMPSNANSRNSFVHITGIGPNEPLDESSSSDDEFPDYLEESESNIRSIRPVKEATSGETQKEPCAATAEELLTRTQNKMLSICSGAKHDGTFGALYFDSMIVAQLSSQMICAIEGWSWGHVELESLSTHQITLLFFGALPADVQVQWLRRISTISMDSNELLESPISGLGKDINPTLLQLEDEPLVSFFRRNPRAAILSGRLITTFEDVNQLRTSLDNALSYNLEAEKTLELSYKLASHSMQQLLKDVETHFKKVNRILELNESILKDEEKKKSGQDEIKKESNSMLSSDENSIIEQKDVQTIRTILESASTGASILPPWLVLKSTELKHGENLDSEKDFRIIPTYLLRPRVEWNLIRLISRLSHEYSEKLIEVRKSHDESNSGIRMRILRKYASMLRHAAKTPHVTKLSSSDILTLSTATKVPNQNNQKGLQSLSTPEGMNFNGYSVEKRLFESILNTIISMNDENAPKFQGMNYIFSSNSSKSKGSSEAKQVLVDSLVPIVGVLRYSPSHKDESEQKTVKLPPISPASPDEAQFSHTSRLPHPSFSTRSRTTPAKSQEAFVQPGDKGDLLFPNEIELITLAKRLALQVVPEDNTKQGTEQKVGFPEILNKIYKGYHLNLQALWRDTFTKEVVSIDEFKKLAIQWFTVVVEIPENSTLDLFVPIIDAKLKTIDGKKFSELKTVRSDQFPRIWQKIEEILIALKYYGVQWTAGCIHSISRSECNAILKRYPQSMIIRFASQEGLAISTSLDQHYEVKLEDKLYDPEMAVYTEIQAVQKKKPSVQTALMKDGKMLPIDDFRELFKR